MDTKLGTLISHAQDGNIKLAIDEAKIELPKLSDNEEKEYCENFLQRFTVENKSLCYKDDPILDKVISIFEDYWRHAMITDNTELSNDASLVSNIKNSFPECSNSIAADEIFDSLSCLLESKGYYSLFGRTIPYLDMLIWRKEETDNRHIELIDSSVDVQVKKLSDFISLGWMGFSTLNIIYVGGWAVNKIIHAVMPAWDNIDEEYFSTRLITHEAQHCSDYLRFPNIQPTDLEYRAKLTEIYYAKRIKGVILKKIESEAQENGQGPHSKASYRIISQLKEQVDIHDCIKNDKYDSLNELVHDLFISDSKAKKEEFA
jgi:hypothetical protein